MAADRRSSSQLTEQNLALMKLEPITFMDIADRSDISTTCSDDILLYTVSQGTEDDGQPCWTKTRVLKLATELLEGYSDPLLQEQLKALVAKAPNEKAVPGRTELALTVQSKVLPKYGFQPTLEGVDAMTKMFASYMMDWMVEKLVHDIERTLGLPMGATLEAACGPLREVKQADAISLEEEERSPLSAPALRTESMSKVSAKPSLSARQAPSPSLSKVQALEMLGELLEAYSNPEFQHDLQSLLGDSDCAQDLQAPGRKELVLKAQSTVLPKFGFPGNTFGAMLMLDALAPFLDDFLVNHLVAELHVKLGLPRHTTINMCRDAFCMEEPEKPESQPCQTVHLTREQVLALAGELLDGFRAPEFQEALRELLAESSGMSVVQGRAELALAVQKKALPKYGIAGTATGVSKMLESFAVFAFEGDWLVSRILSDIDECMGLPRETTVRHLFAVSGGLL